MAESALFQSYRESQQRKARRALDAALARVDAAKAEAAAAPNIAPMQEAPAPLAEPGRESGVMASIGRGLAAVPKRFVEGGKQFLTGGQQIADAIYPGMPASGANASVVGGAVNLLAGAINTVFPFSAFAQETGGDAGEWLARATSTMSDATLDTWVAQAEQQAKIHGGDADHARVMIENLRRLRDLPEAERYAEIRTLWGNVAEGLAGVIPGYTGPAAKRSKPVLHR